MKKFYIFGIILCLVSVLSYSQDVVNTNFVLSAHVSRMFPGHTVEQVMREKKDTVLSKTTFFWIYPSDGSVYRNFWAHLERDPKPSKYALGKGDIVWAYQGKIFYYPGYENGGAVIEKTTRVTVSGYVEIRYQ